MLTLGFSRRPQMLWNGTMNSTATEKETDYTFGMALASTQKVLVRCSRKMAQSLTRADTQDEVMPVHLVDGEWKAVRRERI